MLLLDHALDVFKDNCILAREVVLWRVEGWWFEHGSNLSLVGRGDAVLGMVVDPCEIFKYTIIVMQMQVVVDVRGVELGWEILKLTVEELRRRIVGWVGEEMVVNPIVTHHPWVLNALLTLLEGAHLPLFGMCS